MKPSALRQSMLATLSALLSACASAPEHLYTLETTAPHPAPARPDRHVVLVEPVSVPELVDRPQLVVREGKYNVVVREQERWAIPLKEMLPQIVANDLGTRCPGADFLSIPETTSSEHHAALFVAFTTIEINAATGVSIVASWVYRDGKIPSAEGVGEGHAEIDSKSVSSEVDGVQRALGVWADAVARQLPVCR
jgi:uncharacterized protein